MSTIDPFRTLGITNGISIDADSIVYLPKEASLRSGADSERSGTFHDYIEDISVESTWVVFAGGWIDNHSATQKYSLSSLE